jgi:hypothetical protein
MEGLKVLLRTLINRHEAQRMRARRGQCFRNTTVPVSSMPTTGEICWAMTSAADHTPGITDTDA